MRLEDLTVALRPRQAWEAGDLGCALVRRDFGRILSLWASTVLPLWLLLALLMRHAPAYFPLAVWWLKPLYDRLPLHFISRSTFGNRPSFLATWKTWPLLWSRFFLPALLWRRLSLMRSFILPIWMLEGLSRKPLQRRAHALSYDGANAAVRLTWVFIKLEFAVFLGLLVLTSFAAPASGLPSLDEWVAGSVDLTQLTIFDAFYWWTSFWYLVAITIVEPFYVGAGFGLYLNSRSKLEGWDIDLAFRQTAHRLRQLASPAVTALCLLVTLLSLSAPAPAQAQDPTSVATPSGNALAAEILTESDFTIHTQSQRHWISHQSSSETSSNALGFLLSILGYIAMAAGLIVLIVLLIRWSARFRLPALPAHAPPPPPPTLIFGLDISPHSLPTDLLGTARSTWASGQTKKALSLLYRGALSHLTHHLALPILPSDTERDCLHHVTQHQPPAIAHFFQHLTQVWTRTAYANQIPPQIEFETLCHHWPFPPTTAATPKIKSQLLLATLLLAVSLQPACNGHWEEDVQEVGFRGPARIDPFLAAQRFLTARGHEAERSPSLFPLPHPYHGLVFTSGEAGMPAGRATQLLAWVHDGGHLIYAIAGGSPYNDWSITSTLSSFGYFGNDDRPDPLLQALQITARNRRSKAEKDALVGQILSPEKKSSKSDPPPSNPRPSSAKIETPEDVITVTTTLEWDRQKIALEVPDYLTFAINRPLRSQEYLAGQADAAHLLSLRHGSGRITLLPHARPLRNRYLGTADHGQLLDALAGHTPTHARFVIGLNGSFLALLWERAWRLIIGLTLLLLFWLWNRLPRFGPVRSAILHPTKRFVDHLESLGHFYYSLRRQDYLLTAAQQSLHHRLIETHPYLTDSAAQITLLASRSGLPTDRIHAALAPPQKASTIHLIRHLQDLQTLRLSLS
jgi:hypothetical protein